MRGIELNSIWHGKPEVRGRSGEIRTCGDVGGGRERFMRTAQNR